MVLLEVVGVEAGLGFGDAAVQAVEVLEKFFAEGGSAIVEGVQKLGFLGAHFGEAPLHGGPGRGGRAVSPRVGVRMVPRSRHRPMRRLNPQRLRSLRSRLTNRLPHCRPKIRR